MKKFFQEIYLRERFFIYWLAVVGLFVVSFSIPLLYSIAQAALIGLLAITFLDIFILFFSKANIKGRRRTNTQLSLGDENPVELILTSKYGMPVSLKVIDELPYQLQIRDFEEWTTLKPGESKSIEYTIKPNKRGSFVFNDINVYVSSVLKIVERRIRINATQELKVYPSILQMKKYELNVFSKTAVFHGIKKIRRLGNNNEFEQIKPYVQGDDYRSINWKATSRRNELMVNQYQDERSQQVYCIIDKSRSMRAPFNDLSLLDYAINSSLVLSNIILRKGDKAGVMTYSDKLGSTIPAESNSGQLRRIMDLLYRQKTEFLDANFERLYYGTRNIIKGRSLIILFTNFESMYSLKRNLPLLRRINQNHLLLVVFFKNTELAKTADMDGTHVKDIYNKTLAGKFQLEKELIAFELRKYGIQSILTDPEELSVNTINKYLELKSRGMI